MVLFAILFVLIIEFPLIAIPSIFAGLIAYIYYQYRKQK
jgi:hypothetical protein